MKAFLNFVIYPKGIYAILRSDLTKSMKIKFGSLGLAEENKVLGNASNKRLKKVLKDSKIKILL